MKSCPLAKLTPQRILIVKPSAIGDIAHSLPVLSALRQRFPKTHITWLVNHSFESLLSGHPHLNATLPFDRNALKGGIRKSVNSATSLWRSLRRGQFDLVIDLQGLFRTGLMTLATGAPRRVGLAGSREGASWFYTDLISDPGRSGLHAVNRYWRVVQALGADLHPPQFHLPVDPALRLWADQVLAPFPRPWMALAAGSKWPTKCWPPEHFASVANQAHKDFAGSAILVGSKEDVSLSQQVTQHLLGPALDLTGQTSLPQLVAILSRMDLMLANDTGPLHLAVALGRPVVAPYTCTKSSLTGPYGQLHRGIETSVWCAGSYRKRCHRMECMTELTPNRLYPTLREVLQEWVQVSRSA